MKIRAHPSNLSKFYRIFSPFLCLTVFTLNFFVSTNLPSWYSERTWFINVSSHNLITYIAIATENHFFPVLFFGMQETSIFSLISHSHCKNHDLETKTPESI